MQPSTPSVQNALAALGIASRVVEYPTTGRTSAEAAATLGCDVGQIATSLIFRKESGEPLLVIASGAHRIDIAKLETAAGERIHKADAAFVREVTGYAIGGIPPLGHARRIDALVDTALLAFDTVHAAGGTPHAMFPIRPAELVRASGGRLADVALAPAS
jgi:prolyl-tRNA editing enzyme YbaK/EbsC (Cys-tRNA(Pro) deacylase)